MKNSIYCLLLVVFTVASCKKDKPDTPAGPAETATLSFEMQSIAGSDQEPLTLNKSYRNANGDSVTFTAFRYWLSNVVLVRADGSEWAAPDSYFLLENTAAKVREEFSIPNIPAGDYTSIRFSVGVDPLHNASLDAAKGELSPSVDMSWTWNTGYIFLKAEGTYYNPDSLKKLNWLYHVGTNTNYRQVSLSFPAKTTMGAGKTPGMHIVVDALKLFGPTPHTMKLRSTAMIMTGPADKATEVADNYAALFALHHIHP